MPGFPAYAQQENWQGSCAYAAACGLLKYQLDFSDAQFVRDHYHGSAGPLELERLFDRLHISWTATHNHNTDYLKRCLDSGRLCVVGLRPGYACLPYGARSNHALIVFSYSDEWVGLYDSNHNRPPCTRYVRTADFQRQWLGWAVSISLWGF